MSARYAQPAGIIHIGHLGGAREEEDQDVIQTWSSPPCARLPTESRGWMRPRELYSPAVAPKLF